MAYIGYLALERSVSPELLPPYISEISRYHELHMLPSPTRTPLVNALRKAYARSYDDTSTQNATLVSFPAQIMTKIVTAVLNTTTTYDFDCMVISTFEFLFHVISISVQHFERQHISFDKNGMRVFLFQRKGKSIRSPLILRCDYNPIWDSSQNTINCSKNVLMHIPIH